MPSLRPGTWNKQLVWAPRPMTRPTSSSRSSTTRNLTGRCLSWLAFFARQHKESVILTGTRWPNQKPWELQWKGWNYKVFVGMRWYKSGILIKKWVAWTSQTSTKQSHVCQVKLHILLNRLTPRRAESHSNDSCLQFVLYLTIYLCFASGQKPVTI